VTEKVNSINLLYKANHEHVRHYFGFSHCRPLESPDGSVPMMQATVNSRRAKHLMGVDLGDSVAHEGAQTRDQNSVAPEARIDATAPGQSAVRSPFVSF
jgi:hypothetical protein